MVTSMDHEADARTSAEFSPARLPGTGRFATWLDTALPAWVVRHALVTAWAWTILWGALALAEEVTPLPNYVFYLAALILTLPSLIATGFCLWATPRTRLWQRESVLSHFVGRFLAVIFAFLAWTLSMVIGTSISSTIQLVAGADEREALGIGFQLAELLLPYVAMLIWLGLILRCAWILMHLRGWRAAPATTRLPSTFLAGAPRVRAWVIGIAHPGVVGAAGVISVAGTLTVWLLGTDLTFLID
jgi:hypothetical protein